MSYFSELASFQKNQTTKAIKPTTINPRVMKVFLNKLNKFRVFLLNIIVSF